MSREKALVRRELLSWARESAGLSVEQAARKLNTKPEKLLLWEAGEDRPTLGQLRNMARIYKRLFSDFYLSNPPAEDPIPHDFRRLPGEVALIYSPPLRQQIRTIQTRRAIFRELREDLDEPIPRFPLRASLTDDAEAVSREVRQLLGVTVEQQRSWRGTYRAFREWRRRIETHGVLVFQLVSVSHSEMLGISFAYDQLPVVAVNQKSSPNSRVFTLHHELIHVMLGRNGICDLEEDQPRPAPEQNVEVFCNRVAGAILVPRADLLASEPVVAHSAGLQEWTDNELQAIAQLFAVSEEVVLRRLLITGRTSQEFYTAKRQEYLARYAALEMEQREKAADEEIRRNMPREALSNLGPTFTQTVLESLAQDHITILDAARFLSLKAKHIRKLEQLVAAG